LVARAVLGRQRVAPAAVRAFVDEGLGATIPEATAQRDALHRIALHVVEAAVLDDGVPAALVDRDVEEARDATDLCRHVGLELREVQEHYVREPADLPPRAHVLPERPERVPVAIEPVEEVLPHRRRGLLDRRTDAARR